MLGMPQLQEMRWDYKDQLRMTCRQKVNDQDAEGAERHGERTWYVYDAAGQRVRKVNELANNSGPKDERIYLGGFEIYRRHSGPNAGLVRETLHIMDDKQRIALVEARNDVNDGTAKQLIRYQFGNHLGSASLELDDQAQIISYEEYTPYGSTSHQAVRSLTETPKRHRYSGKERDEESGLYYHGARYYAAWLARWTAADPLLSEAAIDAGDPWIATEPPESYAGRIGDQVNLYEYASGRPIVLIDNTGRSPTKPLTSTAERWKQAFERKPMIRGKEYDRGGTTRGADAERTLWGYGETEGIAISQKPVGKTKWMWTRDRDRNPEGDSARYIYTKKGGWIDMAHFLFYAGRARIHLAERRYEQKKLSESLVVRVLNYLMGEETADQKSARIERSARALAGQDAITEGAEQEFSEEFQQDYSTAYTYEDLPSDRFGADFGANYFDPNSSKTLAEQVDEYLKRLGAIDPSAAPNWSDVPQNADPNPPQNKTIEPMYTLEPLPNELRLHP
jgi:RHS repeat-associated protein